MSYESTIHKVQIEILRKLLFSQNETFANLQRATGLSSDHFNFHLKKLVDERYVVKDQNSYTLTPSGKELANRLDTEHNIIEKQPKLSVLLMIEREHEGQREFLFQQRLKQPFYGYWGRFGGKVGWGESFEETAQRELKEESGLDGTFTYALTYRKRDYRTSDKSLLEDKVFIIMHCKNPKGTLIADFEGGHNEWLTATQLAAKDKVFEGAVGLMDYVDRKTPYHSKQYYHDDSEY